MKSTICFFFLAAVLVPALPGRAPAQEAGEAVAVMPLGCTGLSETDAEFMTERLIIELARAGGLQVMERDRRDELLREREFQRSGPCDAVSCLVEAGKLLAVRKIVGGSVGQIGQVVSVQVRMIDIQTGSVERSVVRDYAGGPEVMLTRGMREMALELVGKLGSQPRDTAGIPAAARPARPPESKKAMGARPESRLKAPQVTYGALALGAGLGMLSLSCRNQSDGYRDGGDQAKADSYRDKGKAALAAASGCVAVGLLSSFLKKPAVPKNGPGN